MTTVIRPHAGSTPWFGRWEQPPDIGLEPERIAEIMRHELRDLRLPVFPLALQPLVLPMESFWELLRATADLLVLLRKEMLHTAEDRDGRIAALGIDRADCPMFVPDDDFELRHCADMARADVVIGVNGPKFIEFNVGGAFGGMADFHAYQHAWRRIRERAGRPSFVGVDVWARLATLVERTCAELGVPPSAVVVDHLGDWDPTNTSRTLRLQVDGLRAHGIRARHLELDELLDGIGLPGPLREPLGLGEFDLEDAREVGCDISPARAALDAGFRLIPSQTSWLLHSKKTLARLSEGPPWLTAEERELVDRYVPWSRTMGARTVRWRGRRYDLPRLLIEHQESFLLKGATGCGGKEVVFGARTEPDDWARMIEQGVRTGYPIAQEVVESDTCPVDVMLESGEIVRVAANSVVSPFCLGGAPAGCLARFAPADRPGVVRCADGAVLTCLFAWE
ncbi:hypothetical protein AB0L00_31510 [Actinoallomurus sp. NPDC052308]|uniref:hypothetical protein n=1 Tax=Actinoallomurus sp. NPDC052308 TaxID=3155530 RepID=UPI0034171ED4